MRTIAAILEQFPGAAQSGLSFEEVLLSRGQYGSNRLTALPRQPTWQKFLEKFDEPIIKILLAAALLSTLVDLLKPPVEATRHLTGGILIPLVAVAVALAQFGGRKAWVPSILFFTAIILWPIGLATGHASVDGLAVMVAVVLATGVAFLSEYKSDREFEVLNAHRDEADVKVRRADRVQTTTLEDLVVGDRILLETGDEVPADGRLIKAAEFAVNQSLMTGEAEPVRKRPGVETDTADGPEQPGCVLRGTQVVDGLGEMLATEVGDETQLGQIARRLSDQPAHNSLASDHDAGRIERKLTISKELTPLQLKLENLAKVISRIGYVAAAAIFLALLVQDLVKGEIRSPRPDEEWGSAISDSSSALVRNFMYTVIIIVVAVPEGLPMSVTISLALAMRKMTRAHSLVRQLVACETIGSATVICTDKTGTLTQNRMQVVRVTTEGHRFERGTTEWTLPQRFDPDVVGQPVDWIALNAAVNSTAHLEEKDGKVVPVGNSTEGALLYWLEESDVDYRILRPDFAPVYQLPFSSERKRMATISRHGDRLLVCSKGAPEWILEHSTHFTTSDGREKAWDATYKSAVLDQLRVATSQAMRTLAFAHALLPAETLADNESPSGWHALLEQDLVYDGFVAIRDPLRDDVKDAIRHCREAGIEVKMVTGDNPETARAIAMEIELLDRPDALTLTSLEFNALTDAELLDRLPRLRILARARPLDKLRLVKLLQEQKEVVAVTGDGTNDAPALKRADVGLAMGRSGTEVAKEASKIVLLDDAFSTIVNAVHWGRALYENIQRFIQFQLTINVSALAIAFMGPLFQVKPPFTILQLLWINVIMDTLASIALCSEPPRPGLLRQPPRRRDENILTHGMLWNIMGTALYFIVVMMVLLLGMQHRHWFAGDQAASELFPGFTTRQVSIFFTVYIFFQIWNEINCRSLTPALSGFHGLLGNRVFLGIVGLIVLGQVLIVSLGGRVFAVEPLVWLDWLLIAVGTSSVLVFAEIVRRLRLRGDCT